MAFFVALQWAVDMGMLPYHPGQGVRRVKEDTPSRPFFELDELARLFDTWKKSLGPSDTNTSQTNRIAYGACLLAATTGARMGEVRGRVTTRISTIATVRDRRRKSQLRTAVTAVAPVDLLHR